MSRAARTVFVWGIYLLILGGAFVVSPNVVPVTFGFPATQEVWIRVVGMLVLLLSYYYLQAARSENTGFFHWSVNARAAVIVFFVAFVALGFAQPMLILFGVVDVLGAAWTRLALRSS